MKKSHLIHMVDDSGEYLEEPIEVLADKVDYKSHADGRYSVIADGVEIIFPSVGIDGWMVADVTDEEDEDGTP